MEEGGQAETRPASGRLLSNRSGRATFLAYHSIAPRGPRFLTITPEQFERQLALLRRRRISCGGVAALAEAAAGTLDSATAFLTFDDGFVDNHTTALPLLREYGCRAFVFVLPPLLEKGGDLDWPEMIEDRQHYAASMRSVTWTMLQEMADGPFEVGSHTLTHRHLVDLDRDALREELWESRRAIRERLGRCDVLAYPFGESSPAIEAAAADCGYRFAFTLPTTDGQQRSTAWSIPRINVDYRDSDRHFALKLSPAGRRALLSPRVRTGLKALRRLRR